MKTKLLKKLREEARRVRLKIVNRDRVRIYVNGEAIRAYFIRKSGWNYEYDINELRRDIHAAQNKYILDKIYKSKLLIGSPQRRRALAQAESDIPKLQKEIRQK